MANSLKGKDILATNDWAKSDLDQVLDLAFKFKKMGNTSRSLDLLKGKTLLLLFFRPSTRTTLVHRSHAGAWRICSMPRSGGSPFEP
jgi:aspartate carbamoyltransferase catalytic subunit